MAKSSCCEIETKEPLSKRLFEAGAVAAVLIIIYLIIKELGVSSNVNFSGGLSYLTVFVLGLIASASTCMATSGVLYLSLINKSQIQNHNLSKAVLFNLGRILSYGFFGLIAGFIGKALTVYLKFGPFLTLLAAIFMILLGLDMAKIVSIGSIIPSRLNKSIFENLEHKLMRYPRKAPFFLGAITYLLPCGFTQAVQVYALGLASPLQSALTMIIFAVGTTPTLLLVGGLTSFTKTNFYHYFIKTMGVAVFIVGFVYFSNFFSLYGINLNPLASDTLRVTSLAPVKNGVQELEMKVVSSGYSPNYFVVKKGIPVKWKIIGENVFGCQAYFVIPKLGIQKILQPSENLIEFTPTKTGFVNFSCGMGMYRGRIEVVD